MIKLSVIIPVHNAQDYIGPCLDSVLGQSLRELEVICVDDASQDQSVSVIKEYCKRDSRVRLLENSQNLFAGECRNRGLEAAEGEYIHFLDSDDLVEQGAYERYWELVEAFQPDVIKGRGICFDNDSGEVCDTPPLLALSEVDREKLEKIFSFQEDPELLSHVSVVPWNGIYRRALLMEKGIRFNRLVCVNDRSFFNEVTLAADRLLLTEAPIVRYRINNGASLMGRRARNFDCQFVSYQIVKEQCDQYGITGEERKIVLDRELADVFLWYRRYRQIPELQKKIEKETRAFSLGLDLSPFGSQVSDLRWYRTYLMASGKDPFYRKAGRFLKNSLKKITK